MKYSHTVEVTREEAPELFATLENCFRLSYWVDQKDAENFPGGDAIFSIKWVPKNKTERPIKEEETEFYK